MMTRDSNEDPFWDDNASLRAAKHSMQICDAARDAIAQSRLLLEQANRTFLGLNVAGGKSHGE